MEMSLSDKFIAKLEEKYGAWNKSTSRFGATSFGIISKELSISASQFTKLIYGNATDGMYERSIENIDRLIQKEAIKVDLLNLQKNNDELTKILADTKKKNESLKKQFLMYCLGFGVLGAILVLGSQWITKKETLGNIGSDHPLTDFFDRGFSANFNSPFLDINEVQDYCPCSAFEGSWSLSEEYKLPIPGSRRPGVYYLAKSADVRLKCSRYDTTGIGKGQVLTGFEYLVNEIWVDTKMTDLSPTYFDMGSKKFTQQFEELNFQSNEQFQKVAIIHSFFIDKFEIYPDSIVRKGEPVGRYATDINKDLAESHEIDIKFILNDVLGNLVTTNCSFSTNEYCNPNDLKEKESIIEFECLYTINAENLGIGGGYPYTKGYRLEKQNYADNLTCYCE
jgi:hypothetical protein